jgi:hypothetical protein
MIEKILNYKTNWIENLNRKKRKRLPKLLEITEHMDQGTYITYSFQMFMQVRAHTWSSSSIWGTVFYKHVAMLRSFKTGRSLYFLIFPHISVPWDTEA